MDGIDQILKSRSRRENEVEMNLTYMDGKAIYTITEEKANEYGLRRSNGFVDETGYEGDRITDANLKNPDLDVGRTWIELSKKLYELSSKNQTPEIKTKPFDPNLPPGPDNVYSPLEGTKPIKIDENSLVAQKLKPPETDKEFAEWGLNHIGHLEYNLTSLGMKALEAGMSDDADLALSLYQMFSMYDELPMFTKEGTARAVAGLSTDPFAYLGIATFGASSVGKKILAELTKKGLKKSLANTIKKNYGNDILLAVEGGLYAGSYDAFRQTFALKSGEQEQYNVGSTATMAGTGAVLAPVVGRAANLAGRGIAAGSSRARQMISDRAARARADRQGTTTLRSGINPDDVAIGLDRVLPKKKEVDQDELGFYSKALEAAKELKQEKGTGEQFKAMLTSNKVGVKKDEIFWTGLDEVLSKKKVTKQEIVDHLEQNRVEIEEKTFTPGEEQAENVDFGEPNIIDEYSEYSYIADDIMNDLSRTNEYAYTKILEKLKTLSKTTQVGNYVPGEGIDNLFVGEELNPSVVNALQEGNFSYMNEDGQTIDFITTLYDAADSVARDEYMQNPVLEYEYTAPNGIVYDIIGNDSGGYSIKRDGQPIPETGSGIFSVNEAQIRVQDEAYNNDDFFDGMRGDGDAQFEQFVQPGGENYREILLTLPGFKGDPLLNDLREAYNNKQKRYSDIINELTKDGTVQNPRALKENNPELKELDDQSEDLRKQIEAVEGDTSDHHGEGNVLAHMLVKDRIAEDGGKVLFAEEIQSDWSQAGQSRKGAGKFMTDDPEKITKEIKDARIRYNEVTEESRTINDKIQDAYNQVMGTTTDEVNIKGFRAQRLVALKEAPNLNTTPEKVDEILKVLNEKENDYAGQLYELAHQRQVLNYKMNPKIIPRGPFVDTSDKFTTLALKRLMRYAVDNGYDYVSWATGDVIANRYNKPGLAKVYDENIPNLSNDLLKKLDKGQKVVPLEIEGLGDKNHIAIPITEKLKTSVKAGQPLFTVGAGGAGVVAATQGENDGN